MRRLARRIRNYLVRLQHWVKVRENREANERQLTRAIAQTNRRIRARRALRKTLGGGTQERRERLAEKIEVLLAAREDFLERLDRVERKTRRAKRQARRHHRLIERLRERRRRMREDQEDRLTPNFHVREFDTRDGTPVPTEAVPALREWCEKIGEPLRARFGAVHVTSGYRHAAYNRAIGGASASVHIYDYPGRNGRAVAVDFTCASGGPRDWFNFTAGKADGRGLYSTFHHADTRNNIGWGDSVWYG